MRSLTDVILQDQEGSFQKKPCFISLKKFYEIRKTNIINTEEDKNYFFSSIEEMNDNVHNLSQFIVLLNLNGGDCPVYNDDRFIKVIDLHEVITTKGERVDLSSLKLRGAQLQEANLEGANLTAADLRGANLERANLRDTTLTEVNLEGANLSYSILNGANLNLADLRRTNAKFSDLRGTHWENTALRGMELWGAYLWGVDIKVGYTNGLDLTRADLRGS